MTWFWVLYIHVQTCSELVMPIGHENNSMFPPAPFNLKNYIKDCKSLFGVLPQPRWITTYYGGHVCVSIWYFVPFLFLSQDSLYLELYNKGPCSFITWLLNKFKLLEFGFVFCFAKCYDDFNFKLFMILRIVAGFKIDSSEVW